MRQSTACHTRSTRMIASLLAIGLLLGALLGNGLSRVMGTGSASATGADRITALILQDICRAHTGISQPHDDALIATATADIDTDSTLSDTPEPTPNTSGHSHCAACLIALDIALPEHGGTWRQKAMELALARTLLQAGDRLQTIAHKPHAQGPPTAI